MNNTTPRCKGCTNANCVSPGMFCCDDESARREARSAALAAEWAQRKWAVNELPHYDTV